MSSYRCPCCGYPSPDPLEEGWLVTDLTVPEQYPAGSLRREELWPGVPMPKGRRP